MSRFWYTDPVVQFRFRLGYTYQVFEFRFRFCVLTQQFSLGSGILNQEFRSMFWYTYQVQFSLGFVSGIFNQYSLVQVLVYLPSSFDQVQVLVCLKLFYIPLQYASLKETALQIINKDDTIQYIFISLSVCLFLYPIINHEHLFLKF